MMAPEQPARINGHVNPWSNAGLPPVKLAPPVFSPDEQAPKEVPKPVGSTSPFAPAPDSEAVPVYRPDPFITGGTLKRSLVVAEDGTLTVRLTVCPDGHECRITDRPALPSDIDHAME